MNWVGIIAICVTVSIAIGGALLKTVIDIRREIAELKVEQQKIVAGVAERYVRSPDFAEFKSLMRGEFTAIRTELSNFQQTLGQAVALLHELKGASQANTPPRG